MAEIDTEGLKQKALEAFDDAKEKAKTTLINTIKSEVDSYIGSLTNAPIDDIISKAETIKSTIEAANKTYNTSITTAETVKAAALDAESEGLKETAINAVKLVAEAYKNGELNSVGIDTDMGLTQKTNILSSVDPNSILE